MALADGLMSGIKKIMKRKFLSREDELHGRMDRSASDGGMDSAPSVGQLSIKSLFSFAHIKGGKDAYGGGSSEAKGGGSGGDLVSDKSVQHGDKSVQNGDRSVHHIDKSVKHGDKSVQHGDASLLGVGSVTGQKRTVASLAKAEAVRGKGKQ